MPHPPLDITIATLDDAPAVLSLVRTAYRGPESRTGWTTEADLLDDQRIDRPSVEHKITGDGTVVLLGRFSIEANAGISSEANAGISAELIACCEVAQRPGGRAYFGMFAVQPGLQAGGIGRAMLTAAEAHARTGGARVMEMTVIGQRTELIAWYQRRGYRLTGETRPFPFHEVVGGRALRDDLYFSVLAKDMSRS